MVDKMEYEILKKLCEFGLNQRKIADEMGFTQTKVSRLLRKYGLKTKNTPKGGKVKVYAKCLNCENEIDSHKKYCNNLCQQKFQSNLIVEAWINGEVEGHTKSYSLKDPIRKFLLEKADYKCTECGWDEKNPVTGKVPLQIDHIDGNGVIVKKKI